tara:strand:+ start:1350 stop:1484 length:135 start_codon:yes stop_codon:yes gene_type:complete
MLPSFEIKKCSIAKALGKSLTEKDELPIKRAAQPEGYRALKPIG